ncbi:MAG: AraC family transcriptional regulator [Oscillospiraceae bacterium]|nr:AraC family transcriptional regulator [Oscillospiraceae bacterium]
MRYLAYHEKEVHGTVGFPLHLYCVDKMHPRYEMPFHWHIECEIVEVLSGTFSISLDGEVFSVLPNQCVFIPGGTIHGGTPHNCVYRCLVFDIEQFLQSSPSCLELYKKQLEHGNKIMRIFMPAFKSTQILMQLINKAEVQGVDYVFTATGLLWQWLGSVLTENLILSKSPQTNLQNDRIKHVLRYIKEEYSRAITLKQLAENAGLNPQYFCKVFRDLTGRTPIDYLNYYRIECAAELLCSSQESVTEIALSCGFSDVGYFSRLFHRQKGIAPSAYRKKM